MNLCLNELPGRAEKMNAKGVGFRRYLIAVIPYEKIATIRREKRLQVVNSFAVNFAVKGLCSVCHFVIPLVFPMGEKKEVWAHIQGDEV